MNNDKNTATKLRKVCEVVLFKYKKTFVVRSKLSAIAGIAHVIAGAAKQYVDYLNVHKSIAMFIVSAQHRLLRRARKNERSTPKDGHTNIPENKKLSPLTSCKGYIFTLKVIKRYRRLQPDFSCYLLCITPAKPCYGCISAPVLYCCCITK